MQCVTIAVIGVSGINLNHPPVFFPQPGQTQPPVVLVYSVCVPSGFTASVTQRTSLNLLGSLRHDGSPRSRAPEQLCPVPMILLPSPSELRLNTWVAAGPVPLVFGLLVVALVTPRTTYTDRNARLLIPSPKECECVDFWDHWHSKASARIVGRSENRPTHTRTHPRACDPCSGSTQPLRGMIQGMQLNL